MTIRSKTNEAAVPLCCSSTVWASHSSWNPFTIPLCIRTKSSVALNVTACKITWRHQQATRAGNIQVTLNSLQPGKIGCYVIFLFRFWVMVACGLLKPLSLKSLPLFSTLRVSTGLGLFILHWTFESFGFHFCNSLSVYFLTVILLKYHFLFSTHKIVFLLYETSVKTIITNVIQVFILPCIPHCSSSVFNTISLDQFVYWQDISWFKKFIKLKTS